MKKYILSFFFFSGFSMFLVGLIMSAAMKANAIHPVFTPLIGTGLTFFIISAAVVAWTTPKEDHHHHEHNHQEPSDE